MNIWTLYIHQQRKGLAWLPVPARRWTQSLRHAEDGAGYGLIPGRAGAAEADYTTVHRGSPRSRMNNPSPPTIQLLSPGVYPELEQSHSYVAV
jgi:hypothetical protein